MMKLVRIENAVRVLPAPADGPERAAAAAAASGAKDIMPFRNISQKICVVRGRRVILDEDIAALYGVEVKRLNEQVKRNLIRFPENYMFRLTDSEYSSLRSQSAALKRGEHRKYLPYVFTEYGIVMLSSVLSSYKALEMSFAVVETFIRMRKMTEGGEKHDALTPAQAQETADKKETAAVEAVVGRIVDGDSEKKERKYGFKAEEDKNTLWEEDDVSVYGQQH